MRTLTGRRPFKEEGVCRFDPEHSALIVVDVQNDFCHPDGTMASGGKKVAEAGRAAEKVLRLVQQARSGGVPVVFVRTLHDDYVDTPPSGGTGS